MGYDEFSFSGTYYSNLYSTFRTYAEREPILDEVEEILRLANYLESFGNDIDEPTYHFTNFFVLSKALLSLDVEMGLFELDSKIERWAGVFRYEEDYFLISSTRGDAEEDPAIEVNLLSSHINMLPLFIEAKPQGEFWGEFKTLYDYVLH